MGKSRSHAYKGKGMCSRHGMAAIQAGRAAEGTHACMRARMPAENAMHVPLSCVRATNPTTCTNRAHVPLREKRRDEGGGEAGNERECQLPAHGEKGRNQSRLNLNKLSNVSFLSSQRARKVRKQI